ncbi:MAG TPA: hypothetical protein VGO93_14310 [Candidatus Xenobia bacterium]
MIAATRTGFTPKASAGPTSPSGQDAVFVLNPQDAVVMQPGPFTVSDVSDGPHTEKVVVQGGLKPVSGQYVYPTTDPQYHGAVSFAACARTVETFSKALGHPINWAFKSPQLNVIPDDGEMLNAYYQRQNHSLHFFHATDTKTNQVVWSSDSGEVVSHETGHAILDGLRPAYLSSWSSDPPAFHESFGDVMAMMVTLQDDTVLQKLVDQTGGDLSKPNLVANLGEQLGIAINDNAGKNVTGGDWTRNAINDFTWIDPDTLSKSGDATHLGSEAHSFSRLWTGAIWDVMKGMTDGYLQQGQKPFDAIRQADNDMLNLYANLFKTAPQGNFTYRTMAKALVQADKQYDNGKYADLITKVFTARQILQPGDTDHLSLPPQPIFKSQDDACRNVEVKLDGPQFGKFSGASVEEPVDADGSLSKDDDVKQQVQSNVARLIADNRIKWTEPGQQLKQADYFDNKGRPYLGVVTWQDGKMAIQHTDIAD